MRFAKGCALAATSVQAATMLAAIARVEAEEKAKRQDQARSLFRGLSLTAEPMCMSMNTETESTNIMDDIINGDDEAKDDYKLSVESDADGGVISPHELIINPKNSLKEVVSQLVEVSGVNIDDFDITVDEMTESFEYRDHNWKGLSLQSKCDAIHHIFSMPVFHGKFDHLLELVCPKEQTTSTSSTTSGCPALPTGTGTRGSGTAGFGQGCSQGDYCCDYAGGIGCPGSTYCRKSGEGSCYCFVEQSTGNPVDGCCVVDVDCTSRNCDTDVNPSPTGANNRCAPASSPSK